MDKRLAEGRTKKEIIRCLQRYITREMHRSLRADLATLELRLDSLWERPVKIHSDASLYDWLRRADIDDGRRNGVTSAEAQARSTRVLPAVVELAGMILVTQGLELRR
jgi:hypothetical protein